MIYRQLSRIISEHLFKGKTLIILGARQTGKTTLIRQFYQEYQDEALFLNCDEPQVRAQLTDAGSAKMRQWLGNKLIIFIDEAQRVKNIGLTLKIIKDQMPEKQLVVTGSSSLDIASEINEPLTGRKFEYFLYPVSYGELVNYRGWLEARDELEQRILYGMYPEIILHVGGKAEERLRQLAGSYLYKDLLAYKDIRKPALLEKLLQALALQVGSEVSYTELGSLLGVDKLTVENYIQLLEQAFIIFRLNPLSRNLRNELNKKRKIYFWDTGIRNALLSNFNPLELRTDKGALWENFLISERLKANHYRGHYANYYFWRTHQQQEIDFVEEYDGKFYAYELKWNPKRPIRFPKTFVEAYDNETEGITLQNFESFLRL